MINKNMKLNSSLQSEIMYIKSKTKFRSQKPLNVVKEITFSVLNKIYYSLITWINNTTSWAEQSHTRDFL